MTTEDWIAKMQRIHEITAICTECEYGSEGVEPQGVFPEPICKRSPAPIINPDDPDVPMTTDEIAEYYGTPDPHIYYGPVDLDRCPMGKW